MLINILQNKFTLVCLC